VYHVYVPDKRRHRGAHPQDAGLFAPSRLTGLRAAVADLSWLLGRAYGATSALKIVGDHYSLTARQRLAVRRSACSDEAMANRLRRRVEVQQLNGKPVAIDGYNLLITIESALSGGVILGGRDSTFRDLASMHGSYRTMDETIPALELIATTICSLGVTAAWWVLDSPVSNSGRLRKQMLELAGRNGWKWSIDLLHNPDSTLIASEGIVITSDSLILDNCSCWVNLARYIVETYTRQAWVANLCPAIDNCGTSPVTNHKL